MPNGALNFSDIVERISIGAVSKDAAPAQPGRPVRVRDLKVTDARVDFTDRSHQRPFKTSVGPLTFEVRNFRTAPGQSDAPYRFEAVTESGEKLAWSGTFGAVPFQSEGQLALENIQLAKYAPYYAERLVGDIVAGKISVSGRYNVNFAEKGRALKLKDGAVKLRDLKIVDRADQSEVIAVTELDVTGMQFDGVTRQAATQSVILQGGRVHAQRDKDGSINLLTLIQPAATAQPSVPAQPSVNRLGSNAPAEAPFDFKLGEFALREFQLVFKDLATARPAQIALKNLQLSLKDVTLADGAVMPFAASLEMTPQGGLRVDGYVSLKPQLAASLDVKVDSLGLLPISPYLENFINARITQGSISTTLKVKAKIPEAGAPQIAAQGELRLDEFGLVDGAHNEPLAGFGSLALIDLDVNTSPQLAVTMRELTIARPYARAIVAADKSLNFAALAKTSSAQSATSVGPALTVPGAPADSNEPKIEIGKITVSDGDLLFTDRSVNPGMQMALRQFGGTISGLSSKNLARADVDLHGSVDGAAPVAITGKLDPLGATKAVDLKIDFKNVDLVPLSPYSGKYAGYELARGKLMLDVKFVLDGKKIDASNVVTLNQFTFGQAVKSPDATGLPVRLGVALLKDMNGRIVIDVPVQGSLDDPNFRIGRVVLRVVNNLLTKAAVSPFSLLGSMFGGGGEELSFQTFAPGTATLQAGEQKKLETLVKALQNRPGLSLALEGGYDRAIDERPLKQMRWEDLIRRKVWEQRRATDANTAAPETLEITPEEKAVVVKSLFVKQFPNGLGDIAIPSAPMPLPIEVAPPEPAEKPGFFKRMANAVTFKERREKRAAEQERAAMAAKQEEARNVVMDQPTDVVIETMEALLADAVEIGDDDLRALAQARAQRVRDYFVTTGKITPDRIFLSKAKAEASAGQGARVVLTLQ